MRALQGAGFELKDIDTSGAQFDTLSLLGVPPEDARAYAEASRRGATLLCARAGDAVMAERAADIMDEHGALDTEGECLTGPGRIYRDARAYDGPERRRDALPFFGVNRRGLAGDLGAHG